MRKICTRKALSLIFFLSIFPVFLIPSSANADTYAISSTKTCNWTKMITPFSNTSPVSGGCAVDQTISDEAKCSGTKPAGSSSNGNMISYVCCCNSPADSSKKTTALFTIPDFQVKIPGLDKLATITCTTGEECNIPWIGQYIAGIYNYALAIVGILAAIVLMAGGLMWLISAGDASKITQAKELIIGSISGLVILITSYAILTTINPDLVNLNSIGITNIARVDLADSNWDKGGATKQSVARYCGCVEWKNLYATSNLKSGAAIKAKLGQSPLAPYGDLVAQLGQRFNIDPALVLAIWQQDSSYATAGAGKTNRNPGNVRCGSAKSGPGWTCATNSTSGSFRKYDNYDVAIKDWFNVVGNGKRLNSSKTIRALIKTYAPPSDNNNTQAYINFVMSVLDSAHNGQLKTSDGSASALQKCSNINNGCK